MPRNIDEARRSADLINHFSGTNTFYAPSMTISGGELADQLASNSIAGGAKFGNGKPASVSQYMSNNDVDPGLMAAYYGAGEKMVDPQGFLGKLWGGAKNVFDLFAIPQQIGYQLLTRGDWRKAIPEYLAPDSWAQEGAHHEVITMADIVNDLSDDRLEEWYKKPGIGNMAGEFLLKATTFMGDVFTDPLTYVPVAQVVKGMSKSLPLSVQAEVSGRLARKTMKLNYLTEAHSVAQKYVKALESEVAEAGGLEVVGETLAGRLRNAQKHLAMMEESKEVATMAKSIDDIMLTKSVVPKTGAQAAKALGKEWSEADRKAFAKEYDKAREIIDKELHIEDGVELHNRMNLGPTNTENFSDALAHIIIGTDPKNIRTRLDRISHYYGNLNVSPNGLSSSKYVRSLDTAKQLKSFDEHIARTKKQLAEMGEAGKLPKGAKKPGKKASKEVKSRYQLEQQLKKMEKSKKKIQETGEPIIDSNYSKETLPNSMRRSPLESGEYAKDQFGTQVGRMVGLSLSPKSFMPMPPSWLSSTFREPTRVYADYAPEMRTRLMNGLSEYNYFVNYTREESLKIMEKAGILERNNARTRVLSKFIHEPGGTMNKEKSKQFVELLNAKYAGANPTEDSIAKANAKFQELWDAATPEMREAHDDMRALFDTMSIKLQMKPEDYIEGYVPHLSDYGARFLDTNWFKDGNLPPDMEGLPAKTRVFFGNLLERTGTEYEITDIGHIMDVYTRGAGRKAYIEPMLEDLKYMSAKVATADPKRSFIVGYTDDLIKNLRGEASWLNSQADKRLGPEAASRLRGMAKFVASTGYSAALTGNIRYPVMSVLQALNTTAAEYGPLRAMKGLAKMMSSEHRAVAKAAGIDSEITQIYHGLSSWAGRLKMPGTPAISETEFFIRGLTYHAAVDDELVKLGVKTLDDITDEGVRRGVIANAARATEELNHVFGAVGKPVWFNRLSATGSSTVTQFFSFPFKQTETLLGIGMENSGAFVDYLRIAGKMQFAAAHDQNIDIKEYVGIEYMKDFPKMASGERKSIPVQALINMSKFLGTLPKAVDGLDYAEVYEAKKAFFDSLEMTIPGVVGIEQRFRAVQQAAAFQKGEQVAVRTKRKTNLEAGLSALFKPGSFTEHKYGEKKYNTSQEDFASIFTGMQSVKGAIERKIGTNMYLRNQQIRSRQAALTEKIWDEVRTGRYDPVTVNKMITELRGLGINYKNIDDLKDRYTKVTYAANMVTKIRETNLSTPAEAEYAKYLRSKVTGGN